MWIADTLSRANRSTTESAQNDTSEVRPLEDIDHSVDLSISPSRLEPFKQSTSANPVMQDVIAAIIKQDGPYIKRSVLQSITQFYNNQSELVEDD